MLRDPSLIPLSHQHHNGLALCVMTRRSLAADASAENVVRLARRAIDRYELELTNHFEIEEQVLFPACGETMLIAGLVAEHRAMEGLIDQMRTAPRRNCWRSFARCSRDTYGGKRANSSSRFSVRCPEKCWTRGQRDRPAGGADLSVSGVEAQS